jgi:predicted ATPase
LFSVLYASWVASLIAFNGDVCRDGAAQFLELAEKEGATGPLMIGHRVMGVAMLHAGEFTESRAHFDRALELYDPTEHRVLATRFGSDAGVTILAFRSYAAWFLGYPDVALKDTAHALREARDIAQASTLMVALSNAVWVHGLCGNYLAASSLVDELGLLAGEKGAAWWKAIGTLQQAQVLVLTGNASVAVQTIPSGLTTLRSTGATTYIPRHLSYLARGYADLGRFDDAWRTVEEAITAVGTTKETWFLAETHNIAGEIALLSPESDAAKAEAYFQRALSVAREQQAKSLELRAAMSMARLWRDQGKPQQARELLAPVYGWFTEGFGTLDLKEAKALLDELHA